ncbi:MAG: hypothetical protein IJ568_06255 [Bacilli bacterium]|nr:hypothetical protein [Bacilli bacterium]
MDKKRLEIIKENVYTRYNIASITGIGVTNPDKEEIELLDEIERLNNIINELEKCWKDQQEKYRYYKDNRYRTFLSKNLDKLQELKGSDKK